MLSLGRTAVVSPAEVEQVEMWENCTEMLSILPQKFGFAVTHTPAALLLPKPNSGRIQLGGKVICGDDKQTASSLLSPSCLDLLRFSKDFMV